MDRRDFLTMSGAAAAAGIAGAVFPTNAVTAPESADELVAAWSDFCESLKGAALPLLRAPAQTPTERACALRYLTRLISQTLDNGVEFDDPAFPQLYRSQGFTSQQGGPNPDTSYIDARISGEHEYRLFGKRGGVHFVTFSIMRGMSALLDGKPGFVDNLLSDALEVAADGSFEIRIGREKPAGYTGNFMRTTVDTERITIREIFGVWHEEQPMELHLERIGGEGKVRPPAEFDDMARRVRAVGTRVAFMSDFWVKDLARFSPYPNEFREYQKRDPKKRSIAYTPGGRALVGVWQVQPDEALILEVEPPRSPYWGYELGDYWFEVDYYGSFSGTNNAQLAIDSDGVSRTVVSHADPGGWPNWLSTSGHTTGHMVFRWLMSEEEVLPKTKLVKLVDLDQHLPTAMQRITPAQRAEQLAQRRAGLRKRWPV
jgi:hypothetical protein